jgi:hypothetical protein
MLFIFGWNRPQTTAYGPVLQHTCPNCNSTKFWHLNKISRYFTLFFIPVFPHGTDYWYFCPVCQRGTKLDEAKFEHYKLIAEVNTAFMEKKITEEVRLARLEVLNPAQGNNAIGSDVKHIG